MNLLDKIPADKKLHLKMGALVALIAPLILLAAQKLGPGYAVWIAGALIAVGVEVYQGYRKEGTPSKSDAIASFIPSLIVGAAIQAWVDWGEIARILRGAF